MKRFSIRKVIDMFAVGLWESTMSGLVDLALDKTPWGKVSYADPGYQADGVKRYPIHNEEHVRAALSYINQAKNAAKYSSADLAKVRARIYAAAKKLGIKTAA